MSRDVDAEKVASLHAPDTDASEGFCKECRGDWLYPCPTARALAIAERWEARRTIERNQLRAKMEQLVSWLDERAEYARSVGVVAGHAAFDTAARHVRHLLDEPLEFGETE